MWEISEDGLDLKNSPKKPVWEILMDVKSSPDVLVIVGCYDRKAEGEANKRSCKELEIEEDLVLSCHTLQLKS